MKKSLLGSTTRQNQSISISGSVKAPPNSALEVNGRFAFISPNGSFIVDDVPLKPGANALVVNLRTIDDQLKSTTISVTSSSPSAFKFRALASSGLNKHSTSFMLSSPSNVPFTRAELRCYELGPISANVSTSAELSSSTCVYPNQGVHVATLKVFNGTTLVYQAKQHIHVASVAATARLARGSFTGLMARLRNGNVPLALPSLVSDYRSNFTEIFNSIGGNLSSAVDQFGQISRVSVTSETGELVLLRGAVGDRTAYLINVMLCADGIWRVVSM